MDGPAFPVLFSEHRQMTLYSKRDFKYKVSGHTGPNSKGAVASMMTRTSCGTTALIIRQ